MNTGPCDFYMGSTGVLSLCMKNSVRAISLAFRVILKNLRLFLSITFEV